MRFPLKCKDHGFSLLELAVVFTIIGFLLLAVYGGRYLIEVSRYDQIMGQFEEIAKAVDAFERRYSALPGDIANMGGSSSSFFSTSPTLINGNGNGIIDCNGAGTTDCDNDGLLEGDGFEDLYFWHHLHLAGLYHVPVTLDGSGAISVPYTAVLDGQSGSVPSGPFDGSRIRVENDSLDGLVFDLSFYNPSSAVNNLAILSPGQLSVLDRRFDDGFPTTGRIRAVSGGTCFAGNAYSTASSTLGCIVRYVYRESSNTQNAVADLTCGSYGLGQERFASNSANFCPVGFHGYSAGFCELGGSWTSAGEEVRFCEPLTCAPGISLGQQRSRSCPKHYVGEIIESCDQSGVFVEVADNCVLDPLLETQSCTEDLRVACPLGQIGNENNGRRVPCTLGTYDLTSVVGTCSDVTCGGGAIGSLTTSSCPANYSAGNVVAACTVHGQSMVTQQFCVPESVSCTTADSVRDLACPAGYAGKFLSGASGLEFEHRQICKNAVGLGLIWMTQYNYCTPVTCGNMPVGSNRIAPSDQQCDSGIGNAFFVCDEDGQWVYNNSNCVTL